MVITLADAAQQDNIIVHGETEKDGEQEQRQPCRVNLDLLESREVGPNTVPEDKLSGVAGEQPSDNDRQNPDGNNEPSGGGSLAV